MADLGSIGSGVAGMAIFDNARTLLNPFPSYEAKGQTYFNEYTYVASEWQLTYASNLASIDTQGAITGRVYLDTVLLANQVLWLYHRPTGQLLRTVTSDSSGHFIIQGLERAANIYFLSAVYGTTAKSININITPDAYVEVYLYTMTARRPLVLINGQITEAPDGTTWAVGVPTAVSRYSANVGDGSNTSYTITHSLGTRDVVVEVRDNNTPYGVVDVQWEATTTSAITMVFETAPSTNRYRVNIIAV